MRENEIKESIEKQKMIYFGGDGIVKKYVKLRNDYSNKIKIDSYKNKNYVICC